MGKVKCFRNIQCQVCKIKGTLQVFLNSKNEIRYGRIRHYKSKGKFSYCKQDVQYIEQVLKNIDQNNIDQSKNNIDLKEALKASNSKNPIRLEPGGVVDKHSGLWTR